VRWRALYDARTDLAGAAVVRAMPNIAVRLGQGITTIAGGASAWESDVAEVAGLFSKVGAVSRIPETAFDGVTALSGSGPAYVFLLAESLIEAGISCGLPRDVSTTLTCRTLLGAAQMMAESDDSPAVLPPGGDVARGNDSGGRPGPRAQPLPLRRP